jgi:hypothetical protein
MDFNSLYNLLQEDIDFFKILEKKGARCTKATKQASSYLKNKKYMKCVKNPSGKGYKRIHYGDPNLRIKKSNPKRRKSFRARHKCSTAKPGTARHASCQNW